MFDEYADDVEKWPGAKRAIDEFLGERKTLVTRDGLTGKYYFIKSGYESVEKGVQ